VLSTGEWQNILTLGKARMTLSIYYEHLTDFISWAGPFTNVGTFDGAGAEYAVAANPLPYLTLWGNMSYTHTHFNPTVVASSFGNTAVSDQGQMNAAPAFTANAGGDLELLQKFDLIPNVRQNVRFGIQGNAVMDRTSSGFRVSDCKGSVQK
jgi:hypothetical protein